MADLKLAVNDGDDVIVIAEAGVNHNGESALAHQLIEVAADAGADFVKFQTFDPSRLVAPDTDATPYQRARGAKNQSELLAALALPRTVWVELRDHAAELGIGFLSTPFDLGSAELLIDLGVDALKVSSGELTNLPFLNELSSFDVSMLVSTGMGSEEEVMAAADACAAAPFLAMFHCVSSYPAPLEQCNLRAIPELARRLGVPVGWSDHTTGIESALVAAALGARLFEKHFTIDRSMEGPDHEASLEPRELADYVNDLKRMPALLGDGKKRRMPAEEENAGLVRRSWHAAVDLSIGHTLTSEDLVALRPESGISPIVDIVGRRLEKPVAAGTAVTEDSFS